MAEYLKNGCGLIAKERTHQIEKHGFTGEHHANHPEWYDKGQLIEAASTLSMPVINGCALPINWDKDWFERLIKKSHKERLIISGALLAAEIDRIIELEK